MMKNIKLKYWKTTLLALMIITVSCERGLSDDIEIAGFATTGEIFTDDFVGMGSDFYLPYGDSKFTAFSVDNNEGHESNASIRLDVPNEGDPEGAYAGGILRVDGAGRDLSGYDALTFWAKASQGVTVGEIGFGEDFITNTYVTTMTNVSVGTNWTKYVIPIPNPSRLVEERGMLRYAMGTQGTNGAAYTLWLDDIQFENLGTIGQPRPTIFGGQDQIAQANVDTSLSIMGLTQTFNLENGQDVTVSATPSYFDFETSNPFVASVNELGVVSVDGPGEIDPVTGQLNNSAIITASLDGVEAAGSLTLSAVDIDVISIFSDVFANVPVDNYNGFYLDGFQTTLGGATVEDGNNIIDYTELNFVAIEFYGREGSGVQPVDASEMTHIHIDVRVNEIVDASDFFRIEIFNNFTLGNAVTGSYTISGSELQSNAWVEFDIPLSSFPGLTAQDALGAMIFVSDATIANVSLDNIFFYAEN